MHVISLLLLSGKLSANIHKFQWCRTLSTCLLKDWNWMHDSGDFSCIVWCPPLWAKICICPWLFFQGTNTPSRRKKKKKKKNCMKINKWYSQVHSLVPYSQFSYVAHRNVSFSMCSTAKQGIVPGDKATV